jgi:phasin family protein
MATEKNPAVEMMEKTQADFAKMSESMRDVAEKSLAQGSDAGEKLRSSLETATAAAQKSFDVFRDGMSTITTKAMENASANMEAGMAFIEKVSKARTFAEVLELQGHYFREAFERLSAQIKEAQEVTLRTAEKAAAPVKAEAEKTAAEVAKVTAEVAKSVKAG